MSCGCGGRRALPNSVSVRIRSVELATCLGHKDGDQLVDVADKIYTFVTNGLEQEGGYEVDEILDAEPATPIDMKTTKMWRQSFVTGPIGDIAGMPPQLAAAYERDGITSVGAALQTHLPSHITRDLLPAIYTLAHHGLRYGMSSQEIADWITAGA